MRKLISDKIPDLMRAEGLMPKTIVVESDKEFFDLLKEKVINDLNKVSVAKTLERKADFIVDAYIGIKTYLDKASDLIEKPSEELIKIRVEKVGRLDTKTVLLEENGDVDSMIKTITAYGELSNWPRLVLGRNKDNQVYAWMASGGEEVYKKMTNAGGDSLHHLYEAVKKNDKYEEKGT